MVLGSSPVAVTKLVLSDIILWQHRYNIHGSSTAVNVLLNNSCAQKGNKFIDNKNLKQEHLGIKQLYLDSEGNCLFAKNLCKYIKGNWLFQSPKDPIFP